MKNEVDSKKDEAALVRLLNNKRSLKAFLKKLPDKKYKPLKNKVRQAFDEFEQEMAKQLEEENQKKEVIKDALNLLEESGISKNELARFIRSNV